MSPNDEYEFQRITGQQFPTETIDPAPYGMHPHRVKTGLTPRGKAALALSGAALAATALVGWQISSSNAAEADQKAQELALKQQELRLKELQILGQQAAVNTKTATDQATAFQAKVDSCVKANKGLVGKQLGATYRSVVDDCKAQYESASAVDMQAAASSTSTSAGGSGGAQVNGGVLVGGVALAGLMAVALRRGRRNPA
jgi:hypothetical protein